MSKQHFPPRPLAPASAPARHHRKSLGPLEQWRMWYPESVGCSGHPEFQGKSIMWLSNIYVILWVTIYLPYREREPLAFNSIMCRFSMVFTGDGLPLVEMTAWDIYIYIKMVSHLWVCKIPTKSRSSMSVVSTLRVTSDFLSLTTVSSSTKNSSTSLLYFQGLHRGWCKARGVRVIQSI